MVMEEEKTLEIIPCCFPLGENMRTPNDKKTPGGCLALESHYGRDPFLAADQGWGAV